jgi:hypothetical protein
VHIFIHYRHEDIDFAEKVIIKLKKKDFKHDLIIILEQERNGTQLLTCPSRTPYPLQRVVRMESTPNPASLLS